MEVYKLIFDRRILWVVIRVLRIFRCRSDLFGLRKQSEKYSGADKLLGLKCYIWNANKHKTNRIKNTNIQNSCKEFRNFIIRSVRLSASSIPKVSL